MNCGTGGRNEKAERAESASRTGKDVRRMGQGENFELGTSCKLAPAGANHIPIIE